MTQYISRFLLSLLLCSSSCHSVDSATFLTDEDYRVYSTYLNSFSFYKNRPSTETVVIADSTTINPNDINSETPWSWVTSNLGDHCHYLKDTASCRKAQDPGWASLFENVKQSGHVRQELLLPMKFDVRYPLQLLSQFRKNPSDRQQNDSLTYYIFGLSKISFNADKTKALFFGSFICGGTCGRGELIMLEKINHAWVQIDTFRFWIS